MNKEKILEILNECYAFQISRQHRETKPQPAESIVTAMKAILKRLQKKMLRDGTGDCNEIKCKYADCNIKIK